MRAQPVAASHNRRIVACLPFVEALARRMAASMPNSVDVGDLVQDGVLGLIDASHRFDEDRGIKFETFAERRVRGAMIDALRRDAWPRGVRRQRRELDAAREALAATIDGDWGGVDLWFGDDRCVPADDPLSNQRLVRDGIRRHTGLLVETGEAREVHHFATLVGYGAAAINPYVMFETISELVDTEWLPDGMTADEAHARCIKGISKALLKTISKMGISTISSYCGAQIFEAVGLEPALVERHFTGTPSRSHSTSMTRYCG